MNWGYKLMFVFIAFGTFMGYMVYSCIKTPVSLVSADYYKDELNYQQVIDGTVRANGLSQPVQLVSENGALQLRMPAEQSSIKGSVWFYCVNDGKKDRKFNLEPEQDNVQHFRADEISAGRYIVKVNWTAEGTNFYTEKEIVVQ